ncbi:tRNA (adenosine(37)-N6)-threonylcarbamoyltransferase complex ATPase subunit type 1 TsaE [Commensalibacter oyaizuii]|uniref:tRNA threonylcarbamoyladenosine biosynthesis protein TsaE n=1 Tax=Commensalibacter oyaizuii TaxID=3043873 RepID=A0ABT6Q1J8_9PROT|nr:tRNA (adenosine(37)-N6)-threonylcarbamoyltransferase complex ATPase subunit type 1 TsaE [Commensalibacter sp. TBRC 16381]MDI2090972.1 tRNA (adenosine(37)-N6)-threonylcarbamoyltransferase complex ATPase subunit type 1 TsaE [Commensalibacter sp. TBRC 16381]
MDQLTYSLPDLQATEALAKRIAPHVQCQDSILLFGALGVGKTALARALLRSICQDPQMEVPSPSFTLVQVYESPKFYLYHYDLWRLEGADEIIELDWEDATEGVVIVEWPERLGDLTPSDSLEIHLSIQSDTIRIAHLKGWGDRLRLL